MDYLYIYDHAIFDTKVCVVAGLDSAEADLYLKNYLREAGYPERDWERVASIPLREGTIFTSQARVVLEGK